MADRLEGAILRLVRGPSSGWKNGGGPTTSFRGQKVKKGPRIHETVKGLNGERDIPCTETRGRKTPRLEIPDSTKPQELLRRSISPPP